MCGSPWTTALRGFLSQGFLVKCGSYCKFWGITVDFENVGTTAMQTWGIAVN